MDSNSLPVIDPNLLLPLAGVTVLLLLINIGFYLYVMREIRKADKDVKTYIGRYTFLRYTILGWQHAKELGIVNVMAFWTFMLVLAGIGFFLTALTFMQTLP